VERQLKFPEHILMTETSRVERTLNPPQAVSGWEASAAEVFDFGQVLDMFAEGLFGTRAVTTVVVQDSRHEKIAVEALSSVAVADGRGKGYHVVRVVRQTTARCESDHSQVEQVVEVMVVVVDLIDSIFCLLSAMVTMSAQP